MMVRSSVLFPALLLSFLTLDAVFSDEAITPLIEQSISELNSDDLFTVDGACNRLVRIGSPAIPELEKALANGKFPQVEHAARVLGEIGEKSSSTVLLKSAPLKVNKGKYGIRAISCSTAALKLGDSKGIPILIRHLKNENRLARLRALAMLRRYTHHTVGLRPLEDEDSDHNKRMRERWTTWWENNKDSFEPLR